MRCSSPLAISVMRREMWSDPAYAQEPIGIVEDNTIVL